MSYFGTGELSEVTRNEVQRRKLAGFVYKKRYGEIKDFEHFRNFMRTYATNWTNETIKNKLMFFNKLNKE